MLLRLHFAQPKHGVTYRSVTYFSKIYDPDGAVPAGEIEGIEEPKRQLFRKLPNLVVY
jgi:hypothetical protein